MKKLVGTIIALGLVLGLLGTTAGRVHAAPVSAPLGAIGTVTVTPSGASLQVAVTLKGAASNTLYAICVADTVGQGIARSCNSARASTGNPCGAGDYSAHNCGAQAALDGVVATDAQGNGQVTLTQPLAAAVYVVVVDTNALGDSAAATVNTGVTFTSRCVATGMFYC